MRKIDLQPIYNDLLNQFSTGQLAIGDKLPAEPELAQHYGIARNTLRQVLSRLVTEGYLRHAPRRGTVVASPIKNSVVYFILPYPGFMDQNSYSQNYALTFFGMVSRILYELKSELRFVYATDDNDNTHIKFQNLSVIGPQDKVIISSLWYLPLMPYLLKRQIKGLIITPVTEQLNEVLKPEYLRYYNFILLDRFNGSYHAYAELYRQGARRIGILGNYMPLAHPDRLGFEKACAEFNGDPQLLMELVPQNKNLEPPDQYVITMIQKMVIQKRLDAILVGNAFNRNDLNYWLRDIIRLPEELKIFFLKIYQRPPYIRKNNLYNFFDCPQAIATALEALLQDKATEKVQYLEPIILQ